MDERLQQLEAYFGTLKTRGEQLPSQANKAEPNFHLISAAAGIDFSHVIKDPLKQRINLAAEEIGVTPLEGTRESRNQAQFLQNQTYLNNYLGWLKENLFKLPADPTCRSKVFFAQIALEAGLRPEAFGKKKNSSTLAYGRQLREIIETAVPSIGIEVRVLPQSPGQEQKPLTYGCLLEYGTAERKKELTDCSSAEAQVYNTRHALNRFLNIFGLKKTDPVGKEFVTEFKKSLEKATGSIANKNSRKKFQTEINRWWNMYQRLLKGPAIPDDINQAIRHLIDRSGLSHNVLAKLTGTHFTNIYAWYRGTSTPSLMNIKILERMEELFKISKGTLVIKISGRSGGIRLRRSDLPLFLQQNPKLYTRIRRHLPDNFCTLPLEKQEQIAESIRTDILRGNDEYTRRLQELNQLQYYLKERPEPLRAEFLNFAHFKMDANPPLGMLRMGVWRETTKGKHEGIIDSFSGALCLPADADDVRIRGLGMAESQLTLALIGCPNIVDWFIRFRCEARTQYTENAISLLNDFISMLRRETGWLRQSPHLAARLRPFAVDETDYVPEDLVSRAQTDWNGVCDDAIDAYKKLIAKIEPRITVARDPFLRIEGILNKKNPLKALGLLIQGMKKDLPNRHTQPVHYHLAIRDRALIILFVVTGLRVATVAKLDNTVHLYLEDGQYVLSIPRGFFKDPNSSYFGPPGKKTDYLNKLPDEYGLNEVFKEYLNDSRPYLMKRYYEHTNEPALFISFPYKRRGAKPAPPRLSEKQMSAIYAKNVEKHLVENKFRGTGIPKVKKTGPHSVRHARGTTVFRITGSYKLAGDANQNSERTARKNYSRITNEERNRGVNEILFDDDDE